MARAAVFCIGTELTRGEIVNTNATWLGEALTSAGFEVSAVDCVPDDRPLIVATLQRLAADHAVIVTTGGLGPTTDDITAECAAQALGVPLERHDESLAAIKARLDRYGRPMAASNAKQADFPRGAKVLANPNGTAPGFAVDVGRARAFFMPGVPLEMKPMFENHVLPEIARLADGATRQIRIQTFGMAESAVGDRLDGIEKELDVVIGYRAHFPEIEVKVLGRGTDAADVDRRVREAADEVRARLGPVAYAEGPTVFPEWVGSLVKARGFGLALAESCTGGLVGKLLTDRAGASEYLAGGVVAYSNNAKAALLGVPAALLDQHGAVSSEVAVAMAEGARRAFHADVALSLTGIAGPGGGTAEKPVGLVHWAVASNSGTSAKSRVFPGTRDQIRVFAAYAGLALVRDCVAP